MESTITMEQLLEWGMVVTTDPGVPMKKVLGKSDEVGELSICITRERNCNLFALFLPEGGHLMLNPASIDDLKKLEELIMSYEPNW